MSKKAFYLDPSVLLQAPAALMSFEDNMVIVPDTIFRFLQENMKKRGEAGANAQTALLSLNEILSKAPIREDEWGLGENGGVLLIDNKSGTGAGLVHRMKEVKNYNVDATRDIKSYVLITQNPGLQAEALYLGLSAKPYHHNIDIGQEEYTGRRQIFLPARNVDELYKLEYTEAICPDGKPYTHNEYILVKSLESSSTAMAYYDAQANLLRAVKPNTGKGIYGVKAKNLGQHFALDALMRPVKECPLVILQGAAGTAKTFLSLAAGLEQTVGEKSGTYRRILVMRPNIKFDDTIGFLKGGENEKIAPLIRPILDNIDQLTEVRVSKADYAPAQTRKGKRRFSTGDDDGSDKIVAPNSYAQDLFDSQIITAQAMEYARGRSLTKTYLIIDEAQNMTPEQAFGIVSRAGYDTKIIIEGDPQQVDNPNLNSKTNGLKWLSQRMKGSPLCAQVTFTDDECERSPLASEAVRLLSSKL